MAVEEEYRITKEDEKDRLRAWYFEIHNKKLDLLPEEEYADSEFLMCFNGSGNRLLKVEDVAQFIGCSQNTARRRLRKLEDVGFLYSEYVDNTQVFTLAGGPNYPNTIADWYNLVFYLEGRVQEAQD